MKKSLSFLLTVCLLLASIPLALTAGAANLNSFGQQTVEFSELNPSSDVSAYNGSVKTFKGERVRAITRANDSVGTAFNLYKLSRINDKNGECVPIETANYIVVKYYYESSAQEPSLVGNRMSWLQEKVVPENALTATENAGQTARVYSTDGMVANKWATVTIPLITDAGYAAAQQAFNARGRFFLHQLKLYPFERDMAKGETLYIKEITIQSWDPENKNAFSERTVRYYDSYESAANGAEPLHTVASEDMKKIKVADYMGTIPANAEFMAWKCTHDGKLLNPGEFYTLLAGKDIAIVPLFKYTYDFSGVSSAYINGYEDGTFKPQNNVTRAEACKIIASLINPQGLFMGDTAFSDVTSANWYYNAVTTLENAGALTIWNGNFEAQTPIKRHELVEIIYALVDDGEKSLKITTLNDIDKKDRFFDAVIYGVANGIITGYEDKTFRPDGNITRAETVTVINRLIGRIYNENTTAASKFSDVDGHWAKGQILASSASAADGVWTAKGAETEYVLTGTRASESIPALQQQAKNLSGDAIRRGVDAISEQMKKNVMSTGNTEEYYADKMTGQRWYVSEKNGNDENDGKSPEKPFKTIAALNAKAKLAKGDAVLFERGGLYRGSITVTQGVIYGSYGEGEKPVLSGSVKNYADPDLWEETDKAGVYKLKETIVNVGIMALDHGLHDYGNYDALYGKNRVRNISSYQSLNGDLQFFSNADTLYFMSTEGNPGERFKSIEIGTKERVFGGYGKNNIFDNLSIRNCGSHGIGLQSSTDITVTNCILSWLGGSLLGNYGETTTQYGNAVEIFGSSNRYNVKNNWIYQIYDTAITHQGNQASMMNINYSENLMEYCHWGIECWVKKAGGNALINNVKAEYNVMRMGGYGWGSIVSTRTTGATLYTYGIMEGTNKNLQCNYSIFDRCAGSIIGIVAPSTETYNGNIYIQHNGNSLGNLKGISKSATKNGAQDLYDNLGDENLVFVLAPAEK